MFSIESCSLPDNALLNRYHQNGAYTDCFCTDMPHMVTHSQYVHAFYTTSVFKLERSILKWVVSKPSSDAQVALLAKGETDIFAAWSVENRCDNQLLLCDYQKRTRSWLMIKHVKSERGIQTRLYFGSAVVPIKNNKTGRSSFGLGFHILSWFHKIYSVVLLRSAKSSLIR
ncbi:hypothetical protein [Pseudoalteromonas denitrificans]|uniref:Uncharacterized protein n=1 Tax=Pseudoalteromonas denitrificans DSM 6059 TaxID=1123010 RepID=A0A1I1TY29_9GAMM|nr:hypothetical protein [Pseudoalteromonas denitrificans]SFD62198.1 hypothetical protein SAMN02745724_05005 [Pseudoalteromonas denitrificans DSM 6059]